MKERLQKVLANLGFGSRREIEGWISEGRIKVNGEIAKLGCQIDGTENVSLDDRRISIDKSEQERRVLIYYKPIGEITTRHDPEGRPTIFESLPTIRDGRWITVGRLDINTQGLLLVTNDGELAHRLMHPSHELEREYAVRVIGEFTDEMADNMRNGIEFEDGISKFEEILWSGGTGANFWYHVTVKGGKNREVRRLWESQGLMVSRLIRIRYGNVELPPGLREGQFIDIDPGVLKELVESVGLEHQHVVLDEKQERQRTKARRIGNIQDRRRELSRTSHQRSDERAERPQGTRSFDRSERSERPDRGERSSFNRGGDRFERGGQGDRTSRNNSDDRSSRDNNRGERSSFNRSGDRFERGGQSDRSSRDNNRGERSNFNRGGDRFERGGQSDRSSRDNNRGERSSFNRGGDRFERGGQSDRTSRNNSSDRSFGSQDARRHNRSETRSFNRDRGDSNQSSERGTNRDSGREFNRGENRDSNRRPRS